jgi:hypothetical protein
MMAARAGSGGSWRAAAVAVLLAAAAYGQSPADPPLDSMQRAIIASLDASLGLPGGDTPEALLRAAIKAADADAPAAAEGYLARLTEKIGGAAEQARPDLLADLSDATEDVALRRLIHRLRNREGDVSRIVGEIRTAGKLRRLDPQGLAAAAAQLGSPEAATRQAAVARLARAGVAALPAVVPLLDPSAPVSRQRQLAAGLIAQLGPAARQPLLDWLGTGDPRDWAAVIEALAASGADDISAFLLPPALVGDAPDPAREAARAWFARRARGRGADPAGGLPGRQAATDALAARLDRLLGPAGLPHVDHLLLEPITDPAAAAAAFGGGVTGTVERQFWNPETRVFDAVSVSPRMARAREAMHLARDLQALDVDREAVIDLVLLAQVETLLVTGGDPATVLARLEPEQVRKALTGPEGFDAERAGRVFEQAVERGMWQAAAAVAQGLVPDQGSVAKAAGQPGTLSPTVRNALVRALAVPDTAVQFDAARTLALVAGQPPYRGSSRVLETLLYAATSTGRDRAVVAHPDLEAAQQLATGLSRFGYDPVRVATGRQAIFAARGSADTVLVLLAARLSKPTAIETTQLLQEQGLGDIPAVLVVIDPLDDDGRGKYLTRQILAFCDLDKVGLIDRLESLFQPPLDPETGERIGAARFPDLLAQAAGPAAVDPATRNAAASVRLARAREALTLLGQLGRQGWDVSASLETARQALLIQELYAPAASLLAVIGRPAAQVALEQEVSRGDLPEPALLVAKSAFEASIERWGILLDSRQMLTAYARYNESRDDTARRAAGGILDVLEAAGRKNPISPADAPSLRP